MSGPPMGSTLLDMLEPGWRRHLASGEPAGALDVEPEMLAAVARALGDLARAEPPAVLNRRWPACIVVAVAQVTARYDKNGKVWPTWFRATGSRATKRSAAAWAEAFLGSVARLGVPGPGGRRAGDSARSRGGDRVLPARVSAAGWGRSAGEGTVRARSRGRRAAAPRGWHRIRRTLPQAHGAAHRAW